MNPRIRQFAELSKRHKTILVDGLMQSVLLIDPEKFAELIVQECIDIAQDRAAFDCFPPNDVNHVIDEIRKHFGVEE